MLTNNFVKHIPCLIKICDSNLRVLNICAKFPGSTYDSHIWRLSSVLGLLKHIHLIGHTSYFLLRIFQLNYILIINLMHLLIY